MPVDKENKTSDITGAGGASEERQPSSGHVKYYYTTGSWHLSQSLSLRDRLFSLLFFNTDPWTAAVDEAIKKLDFGYSQAAPTAWPGSLHASETNVLRLLDALNISNETYIEDLYKELLNAASASVESSKRRLQQAEETKETLLNAAREKNAESFLQQLIIQRREETKMSAGELYLALKAKKREGRE